MQPPLLTATIPEPPKPETRDQRAAISGTVTDPTGAIVFGATVKVTAASGAVAADARTDAMGHFNLSDLPAGRYELQIGAPGFRQTSSQVDLQPRETASVKTQLEVGSVSETVEVTAAPSTIQTEMASTGKTVRKKSHQETPRPLPSKLPANISTASGKTMLAVDSAGTLFVSRNSGKSWKAVKPVWPGKVRSIALADPPTANATFQLTTDSGMIWWSRDGTRWSMAPSRQ